MKFILAFSIVFYSFSVFAFDHDYALWKRVVKNYVDSEHFPLTVDYLGIMKNRSDFSDNLKEMVAVTHEQYKAFTYDQKKAYLLNLHGALVIKAVIDQYKKQKLPKSIKAGSTTFLDIFNKKFFKLFGEKRSLNFISKDLAQEFKRDFKFMTSFSCASVYCPPSSVFTAATLDQDLNRTVKDFLSDESIFKFQALDNKIFISDYYQDNEDYIDSSKEYSSLKNYLIRNAPLTELQKDKAIKHESEVSVVFLKKDWALNSK